MRTEMGLKCIVTKKMRKSPQFESRMIDIKWQMLSAIEKYTLKHKILPSKMIEDWIVYDDCLRGWEYGFVFDNCRKFKWYKFLFPKFRRRFKELQEKRLSFALDILYNSISENFNKLEVA